MKKSNLYLYLLLIFNLLLPFPARLQGTKVDIGNKTLWQVYNREIQSISKDSVALKPADGDGVMILNNETFGDGIIEIDLRGENNMGRSFVGIAFHIQDEKNFEAVYFRPFNFSNPDTVRRSRAVQYISSPNYPWEKLREEHPGVYENKVKPVPDPDKWFHAKIVIKHPEIKVFVNGSPEPTLVVTSLSNIKSGKIGLWVGNGSRGTFSNLTVAKSAP